MILLRFLRTLYFTKVFWIIWIFLVTGFVVGYVFPSVLAIFNILLIVFVLLFIGDTFALYRIKAGVFARRSVPDRLSNGDENPVTIYLESRYPFQVQVEVVDEIPHQFQRRDVLFNADLPAFSEKQIHYDLRPVKRGEYEFGHINVFTLTPLRLVKRRFQFEDPKVTAVYPSYLQMRQYALLAVANRLSEAGVKRIRKVGHSMEFDQVRSYVPGDDRRSVNWKASARRGEMMVNAYQDEKQQTVYCLIDKGRVMQSPFEGLTLLDYAINATLVMSNIALMKEDKAGLITFSDTNGQLVAADRRSGHLQKILEVLYRQKTRFLETDFERLAITVRHHVKQRSLLLLFTNFETLAALQRQLPYLRRLAKDHLLVVILFENTETKQLINTPAHDVEQVYLKTIAQRFYYQKKKITAELSRFGIQSILTSPQQLSVNTINKYLELKDRGAL
ncbi:DUF58 domain-containing protein [Dyadobacter psychrotolerans]|uniref:DUF58 domain-containing protein n=1 Tax=Dyadobacter psychrotolerans TaxID=2541721 RepID=A0A4R5DJ23_9BACT|nr:DUF58 domain-containing protein [Dyadobacter psychrotolerans]TDE11951.1 DUF58 domain-containing protein [Dyadobacter psychrotolerans]